MSKNVLQRLCEQADMITYRPHLQKGKYLWSCRWQSGSNSCAVSYAFGRTKEEAYENARRYWRGAEDRKVERRKHFPTIA